jgi:hypothetical protein
LSVTNFVLAWNASAANDLISVDAIAGPTLTIGDVTLAAGTTTTTIAAQFSEAVQGIADGDFTLAASSSVFAATTTPFTATPVPTSFDGKVSLAMTTGVPTEVPVAGTSELRIAATDIEDLATNPIANTAVSITAAP